jgi:hypothetical protein
MTTSTAPQLVFSEDAPKTREPLCPFCGHRGVAIEPLRELTPRSGDLGKLRHMITFMETTICEYSALCQKCGKSYVQVCPTDRLPSGPAPAEHPLLEEAAQG